MTKEASKSVAARLNYLVREMRGDPFVHQGPLAWSDELLAIAGAVETLAVEIRGEGERINGTFKTHSPRGWMVVLRDWAAALAPEEGR